MRGRGLIFDGHERAAGPVRLPVQVRRFACIVYGNRRPPRRRWVSTCRGGRSGQFSILNSQWPAWRATTLGFTLLEGILVLVLLAVLLAFVLPDLGVELKRRALTESADRLRSLIVMAHAQAMRDGLRYRIMFPGTADPNDPLADPEIDVPLVTLQPIVERQCAPIENPEAYCGFAAEWKDQPVMQEGTRCVAVLPGRPSFDISPHSPIAGPQPSEGEAMFVPLTLNPDGTTEWVTFVLTDLPWDVELEEYHVGRILNVIVDGRTGQTWVQRALRVKEVEVMQEYGASPILHQDFTSQDEITEDNILQVQIGPGGAASVKRRSTVR